MGVRGPTISDVAQRAGVSKALVSLALNDRPGVSPVNRDRIRRAAADLGWEPSFRGRSLGLGRSFAIGLVLARDPAVIAADPFFPSFIAGVERELATRGMTLVLSVVASRDGEAATYRMLAREGRVDGVLLTDLRSRDPRIALCDELGLTAVAIGLPDIPSPFPSVTIDDGPGIRSAVEHLVGLGHRSIAHVAGPSQMLHGAHRRRCFDEAIAAAEVEGTVVETDFSAAQGARATATLLDRADRPTAIVYANDPMAIAGMAVAQSRGMRVPDDLSVTGFDGSDIGAHVHPALTSVATDVASWGQQSTRTLLDRIEQGAADDVALRAAELVIRASTAPPREETRR